jgi:hypothetical protein
MTRASETVSPPHAVLMQTIQGFMAAKALGVAAELAIADALASGPKTIAVLAADTGTDGPSLHRLLRALASRGIFVEDAEGRFANTPASTPLRSGVPGSVRDYLVYALHEGNLLAWNRLAEVVRTGEPSFVAANGEEPFPYLEKRPELADRFDRAMTSMSFPLIQAVTTVYDFSRFRSLVDIGGGRGHVLAAIVAATPGLRGVLFDQAHVIPRADAWLTERGVRERCDLIAGSFFESVPAGHDAYLLKHVLHDWDDARSLTILQATHRGMPSDGTLLILDAVIGPGNEPNPAKWLDLQMMVILGGKERTQAEHGALLSRAGFRIQRIVEVPGTVPIIEAKPV